LILLLANDPSIVKLFGFVLFRFLLYVDKLQFCRVKRLDIGDILIVLALFPGGFLLPLVQLFLAGVLGGQLDVSFRLLVFLRADCSLLLELVQLCQLLLFCGVNAGDLISGGTVYLREKIIGRLLLARGFVCFTLCDGCGTVSGGFIYPVVFLFLGLVNARDVLLCFLVAGCIVSGDLFLGDAFTLGESLFIGSSHGIDAVPLA
jgi:hypothetical protein